MFFIGSAQYALTIFNDPGRPSIMDILGGKKTQPQMAHRIYGKSIRTSKYSTNTSKKK
jgi:hypothetical protein